MVTKMKASEIMEELFSVAPGDYTKTCDTLKAGDPEKEVKKIAVSCFPTVEIIREAAGWGADMLIVHEPTFYDHWDRRNNDFVSEAKYALLNNSGMTLYRYHDHPHTADPDMIAAGEIKYLGLPGNFEKGPYWAVNRYTLDTPITPRELAAHIEKALNIGHVRICGTTELPCTKISTCFGASGHIVEELQCDDVDIVIAGEISEWDEGEYARDAAQLGYKKTLLVLGHCGSERDGMRLVADVLTKYHSELEVKYFECGEVYTYSEQCK